VSDASDSQRGPRRDPGPGRPGARARETRPGANRRGSREAVEKRRAARHFNEVVLGPSTPRLDGRTAKKRQRLLEELTTGQLRSSGRSLKPIDVLLHVRSLLELGESIASLRKACRPPKPLPPSPELVASVRRLHAAYAFPLEAYAFVGIDDELLREAGLTGGRPGPASVRGRSAKSDAA
jgi:hypothetical protein